MELEKTRPSILLRVKDRSDQDAWRVFESIYRPVVYRSARFSGLQDADANDVAQTVLVQLSQRSWHFDPQSNGARFRTWLARVTERVIVDYRRKQRKLVGLDEVLDHKPDREAIDQQMELEYRREVFHWAAGVIRSEFKDDAWKSFWMTAVEGRPVSDVAAELNRSPGSIYTTRSRIMRRLKQQVGQFDEAMDQSL